MRNQVMLAAALVTAISAPATAQRGRRPDTTSRNTRQDRVTSTSDTRFTPALKAGQRLSVSNVEGSVTVTQGRGQSAEIVAHKLVRRGNGDLVKAVLEETSNGYRVCTVYLSDPLDNDGCDRNRHSNNSWREPLDVDMQYDIKLPAGVALTVNTVDGAIEARGIDTPGSIRTVDGAITFDGVAPESLNSVDGAINATISNTDWPHSLMVRTVDGSIEITLPSRINARVTGNTIDGEITSDFALTVAGKWGPQSFHGDIGNGGGPSLDLRTVDGAIRLRSSDGVKRGEMQTEPARRRVRSRP
jgi:Putative adhesin